MADESAHIAVANRNQNTINYLCADLGTHAPWIVTIAFYKALQIVEAVFFNDKHIGHTTDHPTRFQQLKTTQKYQHIYRNYSPLYRASNIARYLEDDGTQMSCFDDYAPPDVVSKLFLFHHLKQIENSARRYLANPDALDSVESARPTIQPK